MSEQSRDQIESVLDGMVNVAAAWIQVGLKLSETAISAAADGLQATAEAISTLGEETSDQGGRSS
ncbi:MAG: hypothetical protein JRH01_15195 [Deltaproteobacteria bacterium]|nr:hypothetical protein [Deltaproteobacteria bacterium]MBW2392848.1 hypothetical protein [Deltaproteobacteria bacterium]